MTQNNLKSYNFRQINLKLLFLLFYKSKLIIKLKMEFKDTSEQKIAQAYDRHLSVTANAGSGKTMVLVKRLVNILIAEYYNENTKIYQRINPVEIVAITFTRKAAAEMYAKVVKKFDKMIQNEKKLDRLERLQHIRNSLVYANISTIHSFCSALLREYPIEAGVNPNFVDISEAELLAIKKEILTKVIEKFIDNDDLIVRREYKDLLISFSKKNIEKNILEIINKYEIFQSVEKFFDKNDSEIMEFIEQHFTNIFINTANTAVKILKDTVISISGLKKGKALDDYLLAKTLINSIEITTDVNQYNYNNLQNTLDKVLEVLKLLFTKTFSLRAAYLKTIDNSELLRKIEEFSDTFNELYKLPEVIENAQFDTNLIKYARQILTIVREFKIHFDVEKDSLGGIDFDDMMAKTLDLLNDETVAQKVRRKIKYLLVDEFQDTNEVQYRIIKRLVPEIDTSGACEQINSEEINRQAENDINLFIVGDDKQSIYGFRNADVRVFNRARKEIELCNRKKFELSSISSKLKHESEIIELSEAQTMGIVELSATFRMLPAIASFVNYTCGNLMLEKTCDYDVNYNPLVCGRQFEESEKGSVNFLLSITENKNADEEIDDEETNNTATEGDLLAQYINSLVIGANSINIFDADIQAQRPAKYSDIGIISRKNKSIAKIALALIKAKIPYLVYSGGGFYGTQEITDTVSFLNFIVNPNDDLYFLNVLKSYFFRVNDTDILKIILDNNETTLWKKFQKYLENNKDNQYLLKINEIFSEFFTVHCNLRVSQLIQNLLTNSVWFSVIKEMPSKHQMLANVQKLVEMAREFEKRGFKSIYDFVEELNFIREQSINEGEAVFQTGENAVSLLSVHSSKGLEYPVLALFDTNNKSDNQKYSGIMISDILGISFPTPVTIDEVEQTVITPLNHSARYHKKIIEDAEEKRILYVALTRAKDHLIISGSLKKGKNGYNKINGLLKLILKGMQFNIEDLANSEIINLPNKLKLLKNNELINDSNTYDINIIKEIEPNIAVFDKQLEIKQVSADLSLMSIVHTETENEYFSATKIIKSITQHQEFIDRYILGLPEMKEINYSFYNNEQDGEKSSVYGSTLHSVMENIALWITDELTYNENELDLTIEKVLFEAENPFNVAAKERLIKECHSIIQTDLIKKYAKYIKQSKTEYSMYFPFGANFLQGIIDLLLVDQAGNYQVWDWKTNVISSNYKIELKEYYDRQMKFYCYLVSELNPIQQVFEAKLLLTRLARADAKDDEWTIEYRWTREELQLLKIEISAEIEKIKLNYSSQ